MHISFNKLKIKSIAVLILQIGIQFPLYANPLNSEGNFSVAPNTYQPKMNIVNSVVSRDQGIELAPANAGPRSGNMNGINIYIPDKYAASAKFTLNKNDKDVLKLDIDVRTSDLSPIVTKRDLIDWSNNWLKPYDKTEPEHRWTTVQLRSDLYSSDNKKIMDLYHSEKSKAEKMFPSLVCSENKFELEHCQSQEEMQSPATNEIFYKKEPSPTLILCSNLRSIKYRACLHYFIIHEIRAVAVLGYNSNEQIKIWKETEESVKDLAKIFIKQ